jgi:acyl dehydratase
MTPAFAGTLTAPWPAAGTEIPSRDFGPFSQESLIRYAKASGDDNPLHLDPAAALAAGLPGTPVHGMLMFACFEPFLREWRPDIFITRLAGKFLRPVLAGERIRLTGRVIRSQAAPRPGLLLRLMARTQDNDLAIVAEAAALQKGPQSLG